MGYKGLEMRRLLIALLVIGLLGIAPLLPMEGSHPTQGEESDHSEGTEPPSLQATPEASSLLLGKDITFTENLGQLGEGAGLYYATGDPLSVAFGAGWVAYSLCDGGTDGGCLVRISFPGARPVVPVGRDPVPSRSNYLVGGDPDGWVSGARGFRQVAYPDLWDGVELTYRMERGSLKYAFTLEPGADPSAVRMRYEGVMGLELDATGQLHVLTYAGPLLDDAPVSIQEDDGERPTAPCAFRLLDSTTVGFDVTWLDPLRPMTIDPGLEFCTYLGTMSNEEVPMIAVDEAGCPYVCGRTRGRDFPTTPGAFDQTFRYIYFRQFVLKLDANASQLIYSTFIGGDAYDEYNDICVDDDGCVYLTGATSNADFPTTQGAFDTTFGGWSDVFALKLSPDGSYLVYSTFIGGNATDEGHCVRADGTGVAYITGIAGNSSFPTTAGAYDTSWNGDWDGFVLALNADGSSLVFSTFLGAEERDGGYSLCLDGSGHIYVAGNTNSRYFPTTSGAFDRILGDGSPTTYLSDAFILKMSTDGSTVISSTLIGGTNEEYSKNQITLDGQDRPCIAGIASSSDFPITPDAYNDYWDFGGQGYVAMLTNDLSALIFSTRVCKYTDFALDVSGAPLMIFESESDGWATKEAYDTTYNGGHDVCLMKIDPTGSKMVYATYFGGGRYDYGMDLTTDRNGNCYIVGITSSRDLPTSESAYDRTFAENSSTLDIFIAKLEPVDTSGTVPTEPRNIKTIEGDGNVLVSWDNPSNDGGYPILFTELWRGMNAGDLIEIESDYGFRTFIDENVINGKTYYYAVRATNLLGKGRWSQVVQALPHRPPGPPETLTATADVRSIHLKWTPPIDSGGPPIKGYSIWRGSNGSVLDPLVDVPDVLEYTDCNLTPDRYYYYMVRAFHVRDAGPFSPLAYAAPFGPPGTPGGLSAVAGDATVTISWDPPELTGGKPIEGYRLYRGVNGAPLALHDLPGLATTYTDGGLENGRTYTYAVMAFNEVGNGPMSASVSATPIGPPGAPRNLTIEEGDTNLTVRWNPPPDTGGGPILGYRLYRGTDELDLRRVDIEIDGTVHTDTGLENGQRYYYRVSAWTAAGEGPLSGIVDGLPLGRPSAPDMLVADASLGYIELLWLPPDDDGGSLIIGYLVYRGEGQEDFGLLESIKGSSTRWRDTNVIAGKEYRYMVSAMNGRHEGEPSPIASAVPFGPPTAPANLTTLPGDGTTILTWAPPESDGGRPLIGYTVYRMTASSEATVIAVGLSRTTLTVTGLENGRQYLFRVAAENEAGEGSWAEVTTIPIGRPLAPTSLVANVEDDAIVLTWSVPVNNGGMPVTGYVVLRRTASTDMLVLTQLGNVTRYVDRGARAGTTYHYAVRAVNAVGEGNASEPMQARIPGEGPMGLQGTGPIVPVVMAVAVAIGAAYWFVHRRRHQGEPLDAKPHDGSEE